ncbi:MAG: hypothetical protein LBB38_01890 [Puniceicoccales bacterium]|nr:hypothetical protein [Puniceicoccales bacterium]
MAHSRNDLLPRHEGKFYGLCIGIVNSRAEKWPSYFTGTVDFHCPWGGPAHTDGGVPDEKCFVPAL